MTKDDLRRHDLLLKDKKLSSSLQKMDFEFTKLNLRGLLTGIAKKNKDELTSFARDGSGGVFCFKNEDHRIVYITSEGSAGYVAADFEEFVLVVCTFPYALQDLISVGYSINSMREMTTTIEEELKEVFGHDLYQEITSVSQYMKKKAEIKTVIDPITALHLGLNIDPPYQVHGKDTQEYDQLLEND